MTRLYVALAVCGVCGIGYLSSKAAHRQLLATMGLTADFLQHLQRFLQTRAVDSENYSWLFLPAMRQALERDFGSGTEEFVEYGALMQEAILRYVGVLESQDRGARSQLKNPVVWFRYGIQWLLFLPLTVLRWLGINSIPELGTLGINPFFKFLSTIASVVAFIASWVTIIAGWDRVKLLLGHLHKL